jgi:hypothetical protein
MREDFEPKRLTGEFFEMTSTMKYPPSFIVLEMDWV